MKTMKTTLGLIVAVCIAATSMAQGSLEFNQVKIVSSTQETIPAGKVWKVTSQYGHANNVCYFLPSRSSSSSYLVSRGRISGFKVNGTEVISSATRTYGSLYINNDCTGSTSSYSYQDATDNWDSDPNFFPMWLPAGTTVETMGPTIFLSVVEFNVVP